MAAGLPLCYACILLGWYGPLRHGGCPRSGYRDGSYCGLKCTEAPLYITNLFCLRSKESMLHLSSTHARLHHCIHSTMVAATSLIILQQHGCCHYAHQSSATWLRSSLLSTTAPSNTTIAPLSHYSFSSQEAGREPA